MINFYSKKVFIDHKGNEVERRVVLSGIFNRNPLTQRITSIDVGLASCSLKDRYIKKKGRGIAMQRARLNPIHKLIVDEGISPNKLFNNWCNTFCNQNLIVNEEL